MSYDMHALLRAIVDDGRLDVLTVSKHPKWRYLKGLKQVFKGEHLDPRWTNVFSGQVVKVGSDRPFVIYADGDPIGATPATMRVHPRSLRVVVPA